MSKSPSLRRIQADVRELALDPSDRYYASPLENDMFEWHFTIRGADGTDFEGGVYHGRILLPPEYPFKPPHIVFLTPSGRFETNTKVCLSFSAYHPELWQPAWGIRLILEALISFLPTPADGAIGALDYTSIERKRLAKQSVNFCCRTCCGGKKVIDLLPKLSTNDKDKKKKKSTTTFSKEIQELQRLQWETEGKRHQEQKKQEDNKDETKDSKKEEDQEGKDDATPTLIDDNSKVEASTTTPMEPSSVDDTSKQTTLDNDKDDEVQQTTTTEEEETTAAATDPTTTEDGNDADTTTADATTTTTPPNTTLLDAMIDPLLYLMIGLLIIICFMLIQKWQGLMMELDELNAMYPAEGSDEL